MWWHLVLFVFIPTLEWRGLEAGALVEIFLKQSRHTWFRPGDWNKRMQGLMGGIRFTSYPNCSRLVLISVNICFRGFCLRFHSCKIIRDKCGNGQFCMFSSLFEPKMARADNLVEIFLRRRRRTGFRFGGSKQEDDLDGKRFLSADRPSCTPVASYIFAPFGRITRHHMF